MKIDVDKIDVGRFSIREEIDEEYLARLAQSLLDDGQWHPVIERPVELGRYQLISGHYRLKAAKRAGLNEIEAEVRDLNEEEADLLSLKTNMLRQEMTPREQGLVLSRMMERYGWSQSEIARKLSVEPKWVGRRLRVALDLHDEVINALDNGAINFSVASIIASLPKREQPSLLEIILDREVTSISEAGTLRRQFLNRTIYTIGCLGYEIDKFIQILKKNNIENLIDIRYSSESVHDPVFSGVILKRELERSNIRYEHKPEYGVPEIIQIPYKNGFLSYQCLKQWYKWHVDEETDFNEFIRDLKKSGRAALMSNEKHSRPNKDQKYASHRDILADLIIENESGYPLLDFEERMDL